jgi:uncharacterized protein YjiS (DUF1127 family)
MQFESEWSEVAAPVLTYDPEAVFSEGLDGRSLSRVDRRADPPGADPNAARPFCEPNRRGRRIARVTSLVTDHAIEGFALSAGAMHPGFLLQECESLGRRDPVKDRTTARRSEPARGDSARPHIPTHGRTGTTSVILILAGLWSRMLRKRESRRIRAAWETIDSHTLSDIGISRYEIEHAREARHWW